MLKKLREMMNVKIRLLRGLLEEAIKNIDAGNSNHTEEELNAIIDDLTKLNRGIKRISKTYACEKILHCSPSTFDTYQEMFGIYSAMRSGFDVINAKHNQDAFDLYKYSRDSKDELAGEIGALRTEVAVLKATRPYQDKLIQCDIQRVADHADFNLWRRTCRMISGEVVLPNTPVVTGYGSYNPCACAPAATTPAA